MLNRMANTGIARRTYSERERRAFKLHNLLDQLATDTRGYEVEVVEDAALRDGRTFNPQRPRIPWTLLAHQTRDMTAAGVSGSQNLVGIDTATPADILRPWSVTLQAGLVVLDGLAANVTIPRVTTAASVEWIASELDPLTASQPAVGEVLMAPHTAGALTTFTKQLAAQEPMIEAFVRAHLLRTVGRAVDLAVLGGTGVDGQPLGIAHTPGVDTESGSTLGWSGITAMMQAVTENGSDPTAIITTPAVRKLLQGREVAAGAGLVWNGATVGGIPAHATAACPAATAVLGDFSQAVLGIWGSGPEIALDAYTGWVTGKVSMRVLLSVDVGCLAPASFSVSASVT